MFKFLKDELSDKKWPKVIVRSVQDFIRKKHKEPKVILPSGGNLSVIEYQKMETFFGYYDRSPLSSDNTYLLFYATSHTTRLNPNPKKPIELVLYDMINKKEVRHWEIWSYNWQQGSKVQWLTEKTFIFNNYNREEGFHSIIYDIETKQEEHFCMPHYESCQDFFLTLNFSRLSKYRPDYGYRNLDNFTLDDSNDGVYRFDYGTKKGQLIISIEDLKQNQPKESMIGANHKVNHIMLSPDRKRMMFMHRWLHGQNKEDRLYVYDFSSKNLNLVSDYSMVSHCYWYGNEEIVGYMNGPECKPGYYIINLTSGNITRMHENIQKFGDGHPSIFGNRMVFDTYPDQKRQKHLFLYDLKSHELKELASMRESLGYECQCRCDCHPRFIGDNMLLFDSTHTGKRHLCILSDFSKTNTNE